MRKIVFALAMVCAFSLSFTQEDFRKSPPEPKEAPEIQMGTYEAFELSNGIKGFVVENHKVPAVSFQVYVNRDAVLERDKAGLSDMTGQLLSRGTTSRSKAEIDETVDFIGATLQSNARGAFASALTKHKEMMVELLSDIIIRPSFPKDEFDLVKQQTLSGIAFLKSDPNAISSNVNQVINYGADHPYGEIETTTTVQNVTLDDCKTHYQLYFKPNISYLIVVGDITKEEAVPLLEEHFGEWQRGIVPPSDFETPEAPDNLRVNFVDRPGSVQSVIDVTYPITQKPGAVDRIETIVLNYILGGGSISSRLNQNLREDKGYTYGARSNLSSNILVGEFSAGASVRNEVTDSAITEILKEMHRLRNQPVSEKELAQAKAEIAGNFARSLESAETIANFAVNIARYDLPEDYYQTYLQRLEAVTVGQVQAAAQKYLLPGRANITVVGDKDAIWDRLEQFGEIHQFDIEGNPLETSATLPADMTPRKVIEQYIESIGGRETLENVTDLQMTNKASVQGMGMTQKMMFKRPNMMAMQVIMNGSVMFETKFDGEKGMSSQMGQVTMLTGEELEAAKQQAVMFKEIRYLDENYALELKGIEKVNGKDAYKLSVLDPVSGTESIEYYDVKTGYQLRVMQSQSDGQQEANVVFDLGDYQEVQGIKFPHTMIISGMMPVPLEMKLQELKVNEGISDDSFKVN